MPAAVRVSHSSSSSDSDESESEEGAVGGARHLNLGKENPLLSLGRGSLNEYASTNHSSASKTASAKASNESAASEHSTNHNKEETVVELSTEGQSNAGFVEDVELLDEDEDYAPHGDDEVLFANGGHMEEKKNNGVV